MLSWVTTLQTSLCSVQKAAGNILQLSPWECSLHSSNPFTSKIIPPQTRQTASVLKLHLGIKVAAFLHLCSLLEFPPFKFICIPPNKTMLLGKKPSSGLCAAFCLNWIKALLVPFFFLSKCADLQAPETSCYVTWARKKNKTHILVHLPPSMWRLLDVWTYFFFLGEIYSKYFFWHQIQTRCEQQAPVIYTYKNKLVQRWN